jgi:Amt family ammonium transporter
LSCFGAFHHLQACLSMENVQSAVDTLIHSSNTLFILIGAVMVLAMHAGFAFLEVGTVRQKNQVNALSKILSDFAVSTLAYFFIGYWISYGVNFLQPAAVIANDHGYGLVKFFFLLTFAAAIPAIISGGIAERARFAPQLCATVLIVAFVYPFFEGMVWNGNFGLQAWLQKSFGASFHDFAGSVVVHAMGGWLALAAVTCLARAMAVIAMESWWPIRRRAFRFWRWVRGFSSSAGSASTS